MLTPIQNILQAGSLKRSNIARPVATAQIIEYTEEALRTLMPGLEGVRVHSLRDGVLLMVTESALLAHEVHFRAARLIAAVNAKAGEGVVVKVRYRIEKKSDEL